MPRIAAMIVWVTTAFWLGGLIFLFIAVQALFTAFPRTSSDVAITAAPRLFATFERYQLMLAIVALIGTFVWYFSTRSKLVMTLFVLVALASAGAAISTTLITARMQDLRAAGQSGSPQFTRLHGQSMMIYTSQAALLLAATIILPVATAGHRTNQAPASA